MRTVTCPMGRMVGAGGIGTAAKTLDAFAAAAASILAAEQVSVYHAPKPGMILYDSEILRQMFYGRGRASALGRIALKE
jgi:hypothetical protein